jgi:alpha/beta superfamily hydrolase
MGAALRTTRFSVEGPSGSLEVAIEDTDETAGFLSVICHPHPLHQGTMDNKVVTTLSRTFARAGGLSARFNYRGVGASEGQYDGADGELDDALAVIAWLRERHGRALPLCVAGFSFGGAIAYRAAAVTGPAALVTIAPAHARIPETALPPQCAWLLVQGMVDDVIPAEGVLAWARQHTLAPQLEILDDAGHFFHGKLPELAEGVTRFVVQTEAM